MVRLGRGGEAKGLIVARDLDKKYVRGSEEIHVLQGLNLDVDAGEFVAFMGPSGSGKTTLLNLLGGLDVPSKAASPWPATRSPTSRGAGSPSGGLATSGSSSRCTTCSPCSRPFATWSCPCS